MSVQRKFNKANGVDDLVLMDTITEAAIVDNLKKRFSKDLIYTYIGNVLLSVNPFRNINGMYGNSIIQKYTGRKLYELAPHVYALAEDTYRAMMSTHDNQCVLISGESGAGKTEAAKKLLSFITAVSGSAEDGDHLKEQLLKSNPVLEAFGNAKTVRNDNSSRFGKYMKLSFDYNGVPVGGKTKSLCTVVVCTCVHLPQGSENNEPNGCGRTPPPPTWCGDRQTLTPFLFLLVLLFFISSFSLLVHQATSKTICWKNHESFNPVSVNEIFTSFISCALPTLAKTCCKDVAPKILLI